MRSATGSGARAASTSTSSESRARPSGSSAPCSPARRSWTPAWRPASADAGQRRATRSTARWPSSSAPARRTATRRRSCSTKCSSCGRSRTFPTCATCCASWCRPSATARNRFVCSSRYVARAHRALRDAARASKWCTCRRSRSADVAAMLPAADAASGIDRDDLAATIQALADGRAAYVRALGEATAAMSQRGGDPVSALTALLDLRRRASRRGAAIATNCACIGPAATARSRPSSRSWRRRSRSR